MTREDEGAKDLLDTDLRDEIELVSDLVVAASSTDRHFTPDEVDVLLGLRRQQGQPADASTGTGSPTAPHGDTDEGGSPRHTADQ